jgi:hypothetical protein
VTLFVTDELSFSGNGNQNGKIYPIRFFGSFYVTAADGLNCAGDDPSNVGKAEAWGHFVTYVTPDPNSQSNPTLCTFAGGQVCAPVLVK